MQKFLKDSLTSNPDKGVFLFGKGGSGKTHFLAAMYNYWESNGKKLKYFDDAGLKDELRNAELNNDYTFCYDLIRNYDGIFIDDAGKQQMTPFYQGGLYRVFNEAYKFKKYIFITSNDSLKALSAEECWGPHAARRVEDLCQVVEFA